MSSLARVTPSIRTLSIPEINRAFAQLANAIYAGQGKAGGVTVEDDLTVPSLHIGSSSIDAQLLASLGGFSSRPVAPWIAGSKDLADGVTSAIFSVSQDAAYENQHGFIFYEIDALLTTNNRAQSETGILTYSGAAANPAMTSGVSVTVAVSQALTVGTLTTAFTTTNLTDTFTVNVNANTSFAADVVRIRYWAWPSHGTITLL